MSKHNIVNVQNYTTKYWHAISICTSSWKEAKMTHFNTKNISLQSTQPQNEVYHSKTSPRSYITPSVSTSEEQGQFAGEKTDN